MRRSVLPASKMTARTGGRAGDPGRFMGPGCPALIIMRPPMRAALLRLATTAWADHGGPLRAEGLSPLTVGVLAGPKAGMTAFGIAVRWLHLACGLGLVGLVTALLLAGRSDRPTAIAWEARMLRWARGLTGLLLVSGLAALAYQTAVVTGRAGAALDPGAWAQLLARSQFGTVWLVRHGLLLLLAALLLLREREPSPADRLAFRGEAWLLAAVGAGAMAWAGHAAAVEPRGLAAALLDALHLIAAGAWFGALLPLAALLRAASGESGADARPFAVLAVRGFSRVALALMLLVVTTGAANAWFQVGSVPALVGTRYGWLLLLKVALLTPILILAGRNRRGLLPRLSGDGATVGRPAMARLDRKSTRLNSSHG